MASRKSAAEVKVTRGKLTAKRAAAGVDLDDAAFLRGLAAAAKRMELRGVEELQRKALAVQNAARRYCPVDKGVLRASILASEPQRDRRGHFILVGTPVAYARPVEFGTLHSAPQPYMRPALLTVYGGV